MNDNTINQLKNDYDLTELPRTTKTWSQRLTTPTLGNTINETVYCPYCEHTSQKRTSSTDDTHAHVICPNCTETIQHKTWNDTNPEPLDTLVFHCPNECHDNSIATGIEIHKHENYYTAICTSCNDVCTEGITMDAHQYEQLKHVLEAEQNGEFRDAEQVTMTTTTEVSR